MNRQLRIERNEAEKNGKIATAKSAENKAVTTHYQMELVKPSSAAESIDVTTAANPPELIVQLQKKVADKERLREHVFQSALSTVKVKFHQP